MDDKLLFELDGKMPSLKKAVPIAAQHLVAMIVGCVTPVLASGENNQNRAV